uniref:Uncharacterized protein n=1 Tax=Leersia perrieri TaxID=77586 RepID=A0A0D9WFR7_9ORYZ
MDPEQPADSTFSLPPSGPRGYSYLDEIRKLSVASDGGSSSSRSSYYCSSRSSSASGGSHHHRYAPYSYSLRRAVVGLEVNSHRDIARRMVRDGFMVNLIREFGRAPGSALERWFDELDVGWVLRLAALEKEEVENRVRRWTLGFTLMAQALSAT